MKSREIVSSRRVKHPSEEALERYALKRSSDQEIDEVEEHLLFCERCRREYVEAENWARSVKAALLDIGHELHALAPSVIGRAT